MGVRSVLVCHCLAVNDAAIRRAIAAGARDESEIALVSGAGSDCGGCVPTICELIDECVRCPGRPLVAADATAAVA